MTSRLLLCLFPVAVLLAPAAAPAQATPAAPAAAKVENPPEQIDAYVALIQADQARDRGNWKTAIQHYREAMKQYAMLVEKFPTWNPEIVQFRLTYCANEVQAILQKTGKSEAELLAGPAISVEDENASYKDRFDAVKREFDKAREELAQLRKDTALYQATARNLEQEAKRLEKDNNRLRLDLTASSNLANRNAEEAEKNRVAVSLVKAQVDEALANVQKIQREKEAAEKARQDSEQQGVQLSKSLAEARRLATEAEGRGDAVRQQLEAVRKELADRDARISGLTNDVQKALSDANRLATELKSATRVDAEKLQKDLAASQAEVVALGRRLSVAEQTATARTDELARLLKEHKSATNDLVAARVELEALKRRYAAAEAEIGRNREAIGRYADATNDLARMKVDAQKLERQLAASQDEAARGRSALEKTAELTNTIGRLKADLARVERERDAALQGRDAAVDAAGDALKTKSRLDEATKELLMQKAQLAQAQKDLSVSRDQADLSTRELKRLRGVLDETAAARAVAERDARLAGETVTRLEKENKELAARLKGGDAAQQASAASAAELKQLREQLATAHAALEQARRSATNAPAAPGDLEKLRKDLVAAQDEVRNWSARHEALTKTSDGLKDRLAELNADLLARDKKATQVESELATLKRDAAAAKETMTAAQKRAAEMEEQVRTLAASRASDLEKLKKHADALNETIDLNQKEMERLRTAVKNAEARVEQLESEKRLLQNENARLKK